MANNHLSNSSFDKAPMNKVCIGIGGGVGPAAGVILHKKIVENTISDGTDQSHCEVHHISRPDVADRTKFLLGKGKVSPAIGMAKTMAALKESVKRAGKRFVVAGVPCNTFHAPLIWDEFLRQLDEERTANTVKMVHMLEETVGAIKSLLPNAKRIGLLSTTGTRMSRVYHDLLEPQGFEVVQVDEDDQHLVHDAIYNTEWGVKAIQPTTMQSMSQFQSFATELVRRGAEAIILGCTEIPLALPMAAYEGVPLIDPMVALARACIQKAGALVTELTMNPEDFTPCSVPAMLMGSAPQHMLGTPQHGLALGVSLESPGLAAMSRVHVAGPNALPSPTSPIGKVPGPMLASSAPAAPNIRRRQRGKKAPVWQQHAAACVIQLAYRTHNKRVSSLPPHIGGSSLGSEAQSRFGMVYSQSVPDLFDLGPASPLMGSAGRLPSSVGARAHVDPICSNGNGPPSTQQPKLCLEAAEELGEELMT
eukprot:TRINITY_DN1187_c0_g1_i3.p1 TRINITY_DN1187_c0_g1~~TRINITY_DN1187_c0_g1_i3.p1  ORF type:complete len:478 (+),score=143.71 TRINITY_DN1187_c0_g1_i3:67-1500(+)